MEVRTSDIKIQFDEIRANFLLELICEKPGAHIKRIDKIITFKSAEIENYELGELGFIILILK